MREMCPITHLSYKVLEQERDVNAHFDVNT